MKIYLPDKEIENLWQDTYDELRGWGNSALSPLGLKIEKAIMKASANHAVKTLLEHLKTKAYKQFKTDVDLHLNYIDWRELREFIEEIDNEAYG